jgi:hypothetical protein
MTICICKQWSISMIGEPAQQSSQVKRRTSPSLNCMELNTFNMSIWYSRSKLASPLTRRPRRPPGWPIWTGRPWLLVITPSWRITPCWLSTIVYSKYRHLPYLSPNKTTLRAGSSSLGSIRSSSAEFSVQYRRTRWCGKACQSAVLCLLWRG